MLPTELPALQGLYAITRQLPDTTRLLDEAGSALEGGVRWIQYRAKTLPRSLRETQAAALADLCHKFQAVLIVNDQLDLALACGAQGVHLGRDDLTVGEARTLLAGRPFVIGASCYDSLEVALKAQNDGADYVAFGSFYPSGTKPNAVRPTLALLTRARARLSLPIVAIGGINPDNAETLFEAGADAVAVITALFEAPDIRDRANRFQEIFQGLKSGSQSTAV